MPDVSHPPSSNNTPLLSRRLDFFDAIEQNKRKSLILMFLMFLFSWFVLTIFLYTLSGSFVVSLIFSFIISSLYIILAYKTGKRMILSVSGAKPLPKDKYHHFYNIVEGLSAAAGIPMPELYIIHDPSPNAFATGPDPRHSAIVVTSGLLEVLDDREVNAVLAHEVSHIANYDIRYMMVAVVIVGFVVLISNIFSRIFLYSRPSRRNGRGGEYLIIFSLLLAIFSPLIAELVKLAISRQREYLADANGARMTRDPMALISALEKISKAPAMRHTDNITAPLYFSNPLKGKFTGLFSSHPPVEKRIERLRRM